MIRVWKITIGIIAVAAFISLLWVLVLFDEQAREDCLRREGHIENYTTQGMQCTTHMSGSNSYTTCHPVTYHHWRCVGGVAP